VYFPGLSKLAVDVNTIFDKCIGAFDQLLTIQKIKISSRFILIFRDKENNNFLTQNCDGFEISKA